MLNVLMMHVATTTFCTTDEKSASRPTLTGTQMQINWQHLHLSSTADSATINWLSRLPITYKSRQLIWDFGQPARKPMAQRAPWSVVRDKLCKQFSYLNTPPIRTPSFTMLSFMKFLRWLWQSWIPWRAWRLRGWVRVLLRRWVSLKTCFRHLS